MARFFIEYKPTPLANTNLLHEPRNWFVSPCTQGSPIVVFSTKQEAIDYARSLPQEFNAKGVSMSMLIGWIHAPDTAPLTFQISCTRPIEDRRSPRNAIH